MPPFCASLRFAPASAAFATARSCNPQGGLQHARLRSSYVAGTSLREPQQGRPLAAFLIVGRSGLRAPPARSAWLRSFRAPRSLRRVVSADAPSPLCAIRNITGVMVPFGSHNSCYVEFAWGRAVALRGFSMRPAAATLRRDIRAPSVRPQKFAASSAAKFCGNEFWLNALSSISQNTPVKFYGGKNPARKRARGGVQPSFRYSLRASLAIRPVGRWGARALLRCGGSQRRPGESAFPTPAPAGVSISENPLRASPAAVRQRNLCRKKCQRS